MSAFSRENHIQRIVLALVLIVFIMALYYDSFLETEPLSSGEVTALPVNSYSSETLLSR